MTNAPSNSVAASRPLQRVRSALASQPLLLLVVALQLAIISMIWRGVGQPDEVYASNVRSDSGDAASAAATRTNDINDALRKIDVYGVRCAR